MADVDVIFRPPARRFYEQVATESERLQIDIAVGAICRSPNPDERLTFGLDSDPAGQVLYNDGIVWLLYRAINAWTLEVLGAGTVA